MKIIKFLKNKKAQSTGFAWVYGLIMLFGLGVMYIVFSQVFEGHLVPIMKNQANASQVYAMDNGATSNLIIGSIDKYMDFFHALPYILFFIIVIYMIVAAIRKEGESGYR